MSARIEQHKRRLCAMPYLWDRLKPHQQEWALPWQRDIQQALQELECVDIGVDVFIAPDAQIFGEPGRTVRLGNHVRIGSRVFLHGPLQIGEWVSLNPGVRIDAGCGEIHIGAHCRFAAGASLYGFNHGLDAHRLIREQPVSSHGIRIGDDVWVGANAGITDGVTIGSGAVVAMGAVVTRDVAPSTIVAGVPARPIGHRR